jgi:hypothetical protein
MGDFDLNLSTRPFPAYQLKTVLLTLTLVGLLALSVWQAYGFMYYSGLAGLIRGDAQTAGAEARSLVKQVGDLDVKLSQPEAKNKLQEIEFLNGIIVRKTFSWTRVFAAFERLMPPGAHLVSLRPSFDKDDTVLMHIEAQAHSMQDVQQLLEALQGSPEFDEVIPSIGEKEQANNMPASAGMEIKLALTAKYHPEREEQ